MNRGEIIDLFEGCTQPEHVEEQLIPILEAASTGADIDADEWQTVFEHFATEAEFREARWLHSDTYTDGDD